MRLPALLAISFFTLRAGTLDGIWQSRGYGYVFRIDHSQLQAFEVTKNTCVAGFIAHQHDGEFRSKSGGRFSFRGNGPDGNGLVRFEGSITDIQVDRVAKMPPVCEHLTGNTPPDNFEVFASTFAEQYISFDRRGVDWDSAVAAYRSKVTAQTTPAELFDIFTAMVKPLGDLHTYVSAPALKRSMEGFWRPGTDRVIKGSGDDFDGRGRRTLFKITNRAYLQDRLRMYCRGRLQFGHINSATGYLRILEFGDYSRHNDLAALNGALDAIFSDRKLEALIIDMRLSFGGSDELGVAIASRLTASKYLAFLVQARTERDGWTEGNPVFVEPSLRPSFHGRVVELTGPITMSAAETFTELLMARTPRVTRIGENTQGVFCDILERHLPNGWTFGLPNAVYRTPDGQVFDVTGIPPDVAVPVFSDADVAAGEDRAMARAQEVLGHFAIRTHFISK